VSGEPAIREACFIEIDARLTAIDGVTEVERMPSGDPMSFNALHIFDGGQRAGISESDATRYDMSILIEGYVEGSGGKDAHAEINALYADVVAALMSEPPLGGLVETIDEGDLQVTVAQLASKSRLAFSLDFKITFPTRRDDPAQPA
jgi:hypothetical protein